MARSCGRRENRRPRLWMPVCRAVQHGLLRQFGCWTERLSGLRADRGPARGVSGFWIRQIRIHGARLFEPATKLRG